MYLQISKITQRRLKELKKDKTYEEFLQELLMYHELYHEDITELIDKCKREYNCCDKCFYCILSFFIFECLLYLYFFSFVGRIQVTYVP